MLLAEHVTAPDAALIDFTDSRLAPPARNRLSPNARRGVLAAVLGLLVIGTVGYLWLEATSRRDKLQAELDAISDKSTRLEAVLKDTRRAEAWYDDRPPVLDCMLDLTHAFPKTGEIRVTSLTVDHNMKCRIECKAGSKEIMENFTSRLQKSETLGRVDRGGSIGSGTRKDDDWAFSISFVYDPTKKAVDQ